jgi:hypothetical protein
VLISKYFTLQQLTVSATAKKKKIDNTPSESAQKNLTRLATTILDPAFEQFGTSIVIHSGFRSEKLNKAVGGVSKSQHSAGEAVDFEFNNVSNKTLANWIIDNCEYDQCILEFFNPEEGPNSGWVHVSLRESGNRHQQLIAYKNGKATKYFPVDKF